MISTTVLTVLVVDLLATSGGITQTWTSPMYPKLYSNNSSLNPLERTITKTEDSLIGSLVNIGAVVGAIPVGFIADKIGRKMVLLGIALPHITAYLLYAFAEHVYMFYIGRFINGLALGAGFSILPMYIAEISSDSNRSVLSLSMNMFYTLGNFIPYAIGPYLSIRLFNIILATIPSLFFVTFLFLGAESPYYLLQNGNKIKAEKTLKKLRSCDASNALKEVRHIQETLKAQESLGLLDIFKSRYLRYALIITVVLMMLQQFSGTNAIEFYLESIFKASGKDMLAAEWSTIVGGCTFIFSFLPAFVIKKTGNKVLLAISCLGDAMSLAILGAYFYIHDKTTINLDVLFWLPMASMIAFQFFNNLALDTLPWTISSVLFPQNVKAISSSAAVCSSWFASFLVTYSFNFANDTVGTAGIFWIYGAICVFTIIFEIVFVPETNGKSLPEIQEMLKK